MDYINLTSYCGLWCNDCIPANERLYALTSELSHLLLDIGFKNYADFKSKRIPEFEDYDKFTKVLNAFEKLHCYNYCRKGPSSVAGCAQSCKIRICAIDKGYQGCWDCDLYSTCEQIEMMEQFHPDIKHNLHAIKVYGIKDWNEHREKHYKWSKERSNKV